MTGQSFILFSGTANPALAAGVARELNVPLGNATVQRFPDGEVSVRLEQRVRRRDVLVIQPTCPPVDSNLLELLSFADACRRSSAASITAVIPYFGYARSDKRGGERREPIMARLVATLLESAGIDRVVLVDPHTPQIEGFFSKPVDTVLSAPAIVGALRERVPKNIVVVSPDVGRASTAVKYAKMLGGAPVTLLQKQREGNERTTITHVVGDVRGRPCLIVDDILATGGTLAQSIYALLDAGAELEVYLAVTHALFLPPHAEENLSHDAIREIFVTDTVPLRPPWGARRNVRVTSVAPQIAQVLRRIVDEGTGD
jgi:ribose-phosphate pyrophosphokinase